MLKEKGFSPIVITGIVAGVIIAGLVFLQFSKNTPLIVPSPSPISSPTTEASPLATASASVKAKIVIKSPIPNPSPTTKPTVAVSPSVNPTKSPTPTPAPSIAPIESMTINGGAYININTSGPVPAGTLVNAYINATPCGSTTARDSSLINFTMVIHSASEVPGCGTPGATIQFWVDNQKAMQTMSYYPGKYSGNVILNVSY